jgi:hypothetical protein
METQVFESYLEKIRELVLKEQESLQSDRSDIFRLIEEHLTVSVGNSSDEAFFNGEYNFYKGHYEQSLKCYLEAKEIPGFQFFCYRASSLISQFRGQSDKALDYAQKALKLDSSDPTLRHQMTQLQQNENFQEGSFENHEESNPFAQMNEPYESEAQEYEMALAANQRESCQHYALQGSIRAEPNQSCTSTPREAELFYNTPRTSLEELQKFGGANHQANSSVLEKIYNNNALENRVYEFQQAQSTRMQHYLQTAERDDKLLQNVLHVLNGWKFNSSVKPLLFTEESRKSCGGHYLRWNGKGIAINPGPGFMENFHSEGLCIRDIDFVIVTQNSTEAYADVKGISELNQQLNKTSPERQIIHYYLPQKVCQELGPFLKPTFKQARNTIHKLEMYLDSPDVEKIELEEGIVLHYFQTTIPDTLPSYRGNANDRHFNGSNFGVRLELTSETKKLKVGYLSGLAWSPLLVHHLGHCDLLLASFGNTCSNDYSKLEYNDDSLGYFGIATLLEELAPRLLLITEFAGREGDIRLEVTKKMRAESGKQPHQHPSTVFPADIGLIVDLNSLKIKCSISDEVVDSENISVFASQDSFGRLKYLSSNFCA